VGLLRRPCRRQPLSRQTVAGPQKRPPKECQPFLSS
jgi:hypothetical protein